MSRTIELFVFGFVLLLAAFVTHAWLASRNDQRRMQSTLASQKQLLDDSASREKERDATLQSTLAQIEELKRTAQTAQQIVWQLPAYMGLPQPITLTPSTTASGPSEDSSPSSETGVGRHNQKQRPAGTSAVASALHDQQGIGADPNSLSPIPDLSNGSTAPGANTTPPTGGPAPKGLGGPSSRAEIPAADLKPLYNYVLDCRASEAQVAVAKQNASDDATKIAALTRERDAAVKAAKGGSFFVRLRRNALWFVIGAAVGYAAARR